MITKFKRFDLQILIPAFALIFGVASAIAYWWNRGSLGEDEIIAITHGLQPFPTFFIEILRNDLHPFFYFMLLKFWSSLDIGSDKWVLASSLVCALFSAAVIFCVTCLGHGRQAALWATGLFCALPTFAWAAGNLRMYGLVPGIAVACWYANRELLAHGRWGWAAGLVLLQFLQAYTHAIGFFFAAFIALAALIEQWDHADSQRLRIWAVAQTLSLISMLPVVASALVRGTEPLDKPSLFSLVTYPVHLLVPYGVGSDFSFLIGGLSFVLFLLFGSGDKSGRIPQLIITCGALFACIVISSMGKPMFKSPVFTANLVPFLVIGAGIGLSKAQWQPWRLIASVYIVFMSFHTWLWVQETRVVGNYQPAGQYLSLNAAPGDVVVVPNVSVFWGIMRYAVGPSWGHPLDVMPLQSKEAWTKLKEKLGPTWVERLSLTPATDHVDHLQVRYVIGNDAHQYMSRSGRTWIVHRDNYKETVQLAYPARVDKVIWFGKELSVSLALADQSGTMSISNPER